MKRNLNKLIWIAGLVIMALFNTSLVQAQTTVDLSTHQPLTIAPSGSVFEWHNGLPVSAANLMTAAQIAAAPPGIYYAVYHFTTENCYSVPSPIKIVATVCPATTVDIRQFVDSSLKPAGTIVTWHANAPPGSANRMTVTAAMNAAPGTYFTAYYDPVADCYSAYYPIVVLSSTCGVCPTTAPVLSSSSAILCLGGSVNLSSFITSPLPVGSAIVWKDALGATVANPAAVQTPGVYTVTYFNAGLNCSSPAGNLTVAFVPDPVPSKTTLNICSPATTADLTGIVTAPVGFVVEWYDAGNNLLTNITAVPPGNYTVWFRNASIAGCRNQAGVPFTVTNNASLCIVCQAPFLTTQSPVCNGATYSVALRSNGIITSNAGSLTAAGIVNIPVGTNVTITSTTHCNNGITATTVVTVTSPTSCTNPPVGCTVPTLSAGQGVCNGTGAYDVAFNSNGVITTSAGVISGNMVINIPVGTNVTLTATSVNGCATSKSTVVSPVSCTNPPVDCVTPALSAGQAVCQGTGTYSVGFSASAGAAITASAGTILGNNIINIPISNDVVITAANGACSTSITVTHPADCSTPCTTPGASFSAGICNGTTYSVNITNPGGATITANAGTVTATAITGIPVGTDVIITATGSGCTAQTITITSPAAAAPLLTTSSAVCNGTTYNVSFNTNGIVTINAGTINGNTVTGIPVGTNLVLTAASVSGCATTVVTVTSPTSCTNPPRGCTTPVLSAGQGVCEGTGTYSIGFSASAGATITASAGTVSGNSIINIPIASNVVITAANGACSTSITVTHPADCSTPCATPGASFSAGICNGTTYSINIANPKGAAITASAGTVGAAAITGIPLGTNVSITATANGCTAQTVTISSPSATAPFLATQSPVCNVTTYSVVFNTNGIVTVNAGTINGNMVTGIPVGTNLVVTASSINGCASTVATVISPTSCNPACIAPVLSAGQGVCSGNGIYTVAFAATPGATVTASAGFLFGNVVFNVPIGVDVTITAAFGTCSTAVVISHPADCSTPCASTPASFSGSICNGNTYSVFISNPNGATITASAGNVSSGSVSGIPIGTDVIITATASGCMPQAVVISSPAVCTQPDFAPTIDIDAVNVTSTGREFVVNINNVTNNPNIGQVIFRIRKADGFNITFNATATTANVFGGEAVNNSDWDFADGASFITVTLKPGKTIGSQGTSSIGFKITPIAGTPSNTSVSVTATINNGSGGDSNSANNLTTTSVISR